MEITLEITPFHAGFNTFTVTLIDAATGSAPQNINAVFLRLTNAEARIGPSTSEHELESTIPPRFDSFTWLAIGLSIVVGAVSAYYFRKSKKQLEGTLETRKKHDFLISLDVL